MCLNHEYLMLLHSYTCNRCCLDHILYKRWVLSLEFAISPSESIPLPNFRPWNFSHSWLSVSPQRQRTVASPTAAVPSWCLGSSTLVSLLVCKQTVVRSPWEVMACFCFLALLRVSALCQCPDPIAIPFIAWMFSCWLGWFLSISCQVKNAHWEEKGAFKLCG